MAFENINELLLWVVSGGGAAILAGLVVAYGLENITAWHTLKPIYKKWIVLVLQAGFAFGAIVLLDLGALSGLPVWASGLILTMVGWLASQVGYARIKDGAYANSTRFS
ncbi:MAG: hypothetical protein GQ524_11700 [Anaerolineales bacterium]|nr:hypothetical protein [Anaerolineales bacterium]